MRLSLGDKLLGVSYYAKGKDKPVSITVGTVEDRPSGLESLHFGRLDERQQRRLEEIETRPRPYQPEITIGLGLDRETTRINRDDFDALLRVLDAVRDEIRTRDVEIERYERERRTKGST